MKKAKIIIVAVIIVLSLIVFFQNTEVVVTKILFAKIEMSRAVLLLLTFGLGVVTGLIGSFLLKKSAGHKKQ